jgi:hypothetical protein
VFDPENADKKPRCDAVRDSTAEKSVIHQWSKPLTIHDLPRQTRGNRNGPDRGIGNGEDRELRKRHAQRQKPGDRERGIGGMRTFAPGVSGTADRGNANGESE